MDPSEIQNHNSQEVQNLKVDVVGGIAEFQNSDGESLTEIVISDNELDEEKMSSCNDDSDGEKSVHIIFVRGESENAPNSDSASVQKEDNFEKCEVSGKSILQDLQIQKVRVSAVPCRAVSCPSKTLGRRTEVSGDVKAEFPEGEVEDDFDVCEGMVYEVDQRSPSDSKTRKKRKKKVFKVCKACGVPVERQDFIPHIREHRRQKLSTVLNTSPKINDQSMKSLVKSNTEKIPSKPDLSVVHSSRERVEKVPQSSKSTPLTDRPFKCSACTETFRTQSSLTIHFKSHGDCSNSCPVS